MTRYLGRSRGLKFTMLVAITATVGAFLPGVAAGAKTTATRSTGSATTLARQQSTTAGSAHVVEQAKTYGSAPKPTAKQLLDATSKSLFEHETEPPHGDGYKGPASPLAGAGMKAPDALPRSPSAAQASPADLSTYRNVSIAPAAASGVDEPSIAANGRFVLVTGNWYAAYSTDKGATYTYLNPFTAFGSGFCCDQVVDYDASRNRFIWEAQFNNHLALISASGTNPASYCYWNITPQQQGEPSGAVFDYNHLSVGRDFAYMTSNVYGGNPGSVSKIMIFPLDTLAACGSLGYGYYTRPEFSWGTVHDTGDIAYLGTNWTSRYTLGTKFTIFRYLEQTNQGFVNDISIDPFTFEFFGGSQYCGSADGVVLNWCARTDSRMGDSGWLAISSQAEANSGGNAYNDEIVGFAFNAKNDANHPRPYIRKIYFRTSNLSYIGYAEHWASWGAFQYPGTATNHRGDLLTRWAWGGGTGSTHYYPGSGYSLQDDISPTQPWIYRYSQYGAGNPCLNSDGLRRWGDYLTARSYNPTRDLFVHVGFALAGNAGGCGSTAPVRVNIQIVGRERARPSYLRWS
ncbi:MAG TPA: hypothetical protein VEM93_02620 [Actinomycetota bacterium]|nr:hypothetical protein [Actinomycetota bacterium]